MKIAVLMPTYSGVHGRTFESLSALQAETAKQRPDVGLLLRTNSDTNLLRARTELLLGAEREGARFALWIDRDMTFPPDALLRLLDRKARFIGTNYRRRRDGGPTASRHGAGGLEYVETRDGMDTEEVATMGFGFCLMGMDVLAAIRARASEKSGSPFPLFLFEPSVEDFIGEDCFFCHKAADAGVRMLIDHRLSLEMGHIGEHEWRYD